MEITEERIREISRKDTEKASSISIEEIAKELFKLQQRRLNLPDVIPQK